jgi:hypothetical protein
MKELFNIVDFSMSKDFENIQQIIGRLLRVSDLQPNKQKIYYKVSTVDLAKWYEYVMRCVMCLMHMEWYSTYEGNKKQFKFPYMVRNQNQSTNKTKSNTKTKSNNKFNISEEFPLDLNYVNYIEQNMKSEFATYAWWNLEDVLSSEFGLKTHSSPYKIEDIYDEAKKWKIYNDFMKNSWAYAAARKRGILDAVSKHMKKSFNINLTTNREIEKISLKYDLKNDFIKYDKKYASLAMRRGIWDKITKRMDDNFIKSKIVIATDLKTNKTIQFADTKSAAEYFKSYPQNISNAVTGIKSSHKGFTFTKQKQYE